MILRTSRESLSTIFASRIMGSVEESTASWPPSQSRFRTVEELVALDGETAAEAKAVLVACDEQHRPRPLTGEERAALERA